MGAKVSSHRDDFGRLSYNCSDRTTTFSLKNQSHNFRTITQIPSYDGNSSVFQTFCDETETRETDLKEFSSKSIIKNSNLKGNRSLITNGAMFSEKHSLDVNNDSDSSSSITIGNGTADSILKKLRKSRIQEQKNKSDKTLLESKKGTDDSETKPMIILTAPKHDSVESIFNDQGDNSCVHVTKGPTFKSNLYNGPSLLPASNSKLGFIEQKSGDIVFTAYILMKSARQDEYEMLKKVSQHRIRGLEKQQNCKIQFFDEALELKAQRVYMLQITGPGYREVLTCKNSLPKCIIERLITADSSLDELFSRYQRRK